MIPNPEYNGPWSPKKIKNPAYKGVWAAPLIDNPGKHTDVLLKGNNLRQDHLS
jgi:hypothetical protein